MVKKKMGLDDAVLLLMAKSVSFWLCIGTGARETIRRVSTLDYSNTLLSSTLF